MSPDQRVADRVSGMVKTARRAAAAARAVAGELEATAGEDGLSARGARRLNEAESEAFEFARQEMIVLDVLPAGGEHCERLRSAMAAEEEALDGAVSALRAAAAGSDDASDSIAHAIERVNRALLELESAAAGVSAYSPV